MMCSDPRRASRASGRSRLCVSEMTPIRMGSSQFSVLSCQLAVLGCQFSVLGTFLLCLHFFHKLSDAHHRSGHGAAADFLDVALDHAQGVKASVKRLQHGLGPDVRTDATRRTVLDVDGGAHGDLVALAVGMQSEKGG